MRALIVDDSRFVRDLLRGLLEEKGIECEEAVDGRAGLEHLHAATDFDLALVDWNMPVMNGLDMLTQMRAEGFTGVKVMMVTTEAENDFIVRALDAGADEYLMKPFDDEALSEKLAMLGSGGGLTHGPRPPTRILIVDDSAVMRSLLRSVLRMPTRISRWPEPLPTAPPRWPRSIFAPRSGSSRCRDAGDGWSRHAARTAQPRAQHAGHHVQFAHPARRQGHH